MARIEKNSDGTIRFIPDPTLLPTMEKMIKDQCEKEVDDFIQSAKFSSPPNRDGMIESCVNRKLNKVNKPIAQTKPVVNLEPIGVPKKDNTLFYILGGVSLILIIKLLNK